MDFRQKLEEFYNHVTAQIGTPHDGHLWTAKQAYNQTMQMTDPNVKGLIQRHSMRPFFKRPDEIVALAKEQSLPGDWVAKNVPLVSMEGLKDFIQSFDEKAQETIAERAAAQMCAYLSKDQLVKFVESTKGTLVHRHLLLNIIERGTMDLVLQFEDHLEKLIKEHPSKIRDRLSGANVMERPENYLVLMCLIALGYDHAEGFVRGEVLTKQAFTTWVGVKLKKLQDLGSAGLVHLSETLDGFEHGLKSAQRVTEHLILACATHKNDHMLFARQEKIREFFANHATSQFFSELRMRLGNGSVLGNVLATKFRATLFKMGASKTSLNDPELSGGVNELDLEGTGPEGLSAQMQLYNVGLEKKEEIVIKEVVVMTTKKPETKAMIRLMNTF